MLLVILDLKSATSYITIVLDKIAVLYIHFYLLVIVDLIDIYNIIFIDTIY